VKVLVIRYAITCPQAISGSSKSTSKAVDPA
jgi:hypothetical protein